MIDGQIPEVRPGFTCTAEITTATTKQRGRRADSGDDGSRAALRRQGQRRPRRRGRQKRRRAAERRTAAPPPELKPGQKRKETEGVFVMRDGKADFVPIKTGISGEKYFEVLTGLKDGDQVITGPFDSVRGMTDGDW